MVHSTLAPAQRADGPGGAPPAAPLTAVLADDNQYFRHTVAQLLADHYADLVRVLADCGTGEVEAVCARERPAVVLLDIGLPGMASLGHIAPLRDAYGAAVIVLSMEDDPPYAEAAGAAGARALLGKATLNSTLRPAVLAILAGAAPS